MAERTRRRWPVLRLGIVGVVVLAVVAAAVVTAAVMLRDDEQDEGNKIIYGLTLNPSGFDPHIHISSELGIPFYSVYDTLVYRQPETFEIFPGLAEDYEISDDGLVYTFYLRQDVTFHDGEPFNAQAVAANLDRITDNDLDSGKARRLLGPYTDNEVVDEYTIRLRLSEPYAPLLDGLSQVYLGMASPRALAEYTKNSYQWHQVGTGPYMLDEVVPGERIILRRNPDYAWGPLYYAGRLPDGTVDPVWEANAVDTIEFRFYTDPPTRRDALESGEIQIVGELLPLDAEALAGSASIQTLNTRVPGMSQLFFFNTQREPTNDERVRQALVYATNRTAIVDAVFQGQSRVAYGPLASNTPSYDAALENPDSPELSYPFNPDYARQLLESVGYTDSDGDGWLDQNGERLQLTMVFAGWNQLPDVAQLIQSQWREIGIDLQLIQAPDFPALSEYADEGNFDLIALYDFGVDPSILNGFFLTDGARNWSGFSDAEVDGWLTAAVRESDSAERDRLYASVQRRIMERAVILPIRDLTNVHGYSVALDGVIFSAQGWWPLLQNFQYSP
ncbi:MAG: hypothetical protein GYB65_02170 [Chloroflexi bacterium]|nr:hypothetical protein [Chloroflexota bacterium]